MVLHISREEARRFLALYHFKPADLPGVIDRLGTVQYDPLNPVGRNADLVFQDAFPDTRLMIGNKLRTLSGYFMTHGISKLRRSL